MTDDRTAWHPVALSPAIPGGVTRAVILGGTELVLWRGADGVLRAWDDRCPHRGMRLSYGFVRGNSLSCLYHGWEYEGSSRCVRIPAHPDLEVPRTIRATSYGVHEAGGLAWVSLAGPDAGDPPAIPAALPLISTAVEQPIGRLRRFLRAASTHPVVIREDMLEGVSLLLALHPIDAGRTMLHALTIGGSTDPAERRRCARAVRDLRREAEMPAEVQ